MSTLERAILLNCCIVICVFTFMSFSWADMETIPVLFHTILALGTFTVGWFVFKLSRLIGVMLMSIAASATLFVKAGILTVLLLGKEYDAYSDICFDTSPIILESFAFGPLLVTSIVLAIFLFYADSVYGDKSNNWRSYP